MDQASTVQYSKIVSVVCIVVVVGKLIDIHVSLLINVYISQAKLLKHFNFVFLM